MRIWSSFVMFVTMLAELVQSAEKRATLDLFPLKSESIENGTWAPDLTQPTTRVDGLFSPMGLMAPAHGIIRQVHTCDEASKPLFTDVPWVAYIKLTSRKNEQNCPPLREKAQTAMHRGASAVVFDVTTYDNAKDELSITQSESLRYPLVAIEGGEAEELWGVFRAHHDKIYIQIQPAVSSIKRGAKKPLFDLGIFIGLLGLLCLISFFVIVKLKWGSRRRQPSLTNMAKKILSKMETRRYHTSALDIRSKATLDGDSCAICLEEYRECQELRILPCRHEFHRACVDPWLIANRTCPLCLFNIIDCPGDHEGSLCSTPEVSVHNNIQAPSLHHPSLYANFIPTSSSSAQYTYPYQRVDSYNGVPPYSPAPHVITSSSLPVYTSLDYHRSVYTQLQTGSSQTASANLPTPATTMTAVGGVSNWLQGSHPNSHGQGTSLSYSTVIPARDSVQTATSNSRGGKIQLQLQKSRAMRRGRHGNKCSGSAGGGGPHLLLHRTRKPARASVSLPLPYKSARCHKDTGEGDHLSSSDSEQDVKVSMYLRTQNYATSHCDADISGTSTGGVDSDDPRFDSSLDISNQSICGSSGVPSDVTSMDSNVCCADQLTRLPPLPPFSFQRDSSSLIVPRSRKNFSAMQTSLALVPRSKVDCVVRNECASDSDNSLSSNDTSGLSPVVSDWAVSSCSENDRPRRAVKTLQYLPVDYLNMESCPLCRKNKQLSKSRTVCETKSQEVTASRPSPHNSLQPLSPLSNGRNLPNERLLPHSHSEFSALSHSEFSALSHSEFSALSQYSCPLCVSEMCHVDSMTSQSPPMTSLQPQAISRPPRRPSSFALPCTALHTNCPICQLHFLRNKSSELGNLSSPRDASFLQPFKQSSQVSYQSPSHPVPREHFTNVQSTATTPSSTYVIYDETKDKVMTRSMDSPLSGSKPTPL